MMTRSTMVKAGLVLLGVMLAAGFVGVLEKRFAEGGIYPHYASFRSDPLGTSVLYESLERFEGVAVSRNIKDLNSVDGLDGETVLLLLGYPRDGFEDLRAPGNSPVMKAVEEGARLVITMNPELVPEAFRPGLSDFEDDWTERRRKIREEKARRQSGQEAGENAEKEPGNADKEQGSMPVEKKLGAKDATPEKQDHKIGEAKEAKEAKEEDDEERLEREMKEVLGPPLTEKLAFEIPAPGAFVRPEEGWKVRPGKTLAGGKMTRSLPIWRSQYRFEPKDKSWRSAVLVDKAPVVIERSFGKGTIVLASDTYFASNESLHSGAKAEFLLWLLGGKTKVVFDETIHGTVETGGAMKLIRRYRAHGVFFGLLVFVALWAWRCASPLVPGDEDSDRGIVDGGSVLGEETGSGLIRLLRRSVPVSVLLSQCVEVWRGSAIAGVPAAAREGMGRILERHRADPKHFGVAEAYRAIAELLRKR